MTSPTMRDRWRPVELLAISASLGLFVALVVLMSTRDVVLALISLAISFVVTLVVIAMLALYVEPSSEEKRDILEQDEAQLDEPKREPKGH